jgi:glycosyltransferase involved in cell wall biosynthesis
MKLVVIIPTLGRSGQVARLLAYLEGQSTLPDHVVVSAPDATHVELPGALRYPVSVAYGKMGLCAQRNAALGGVLGAYDVVTFLDDDFVPATDYLERVRNAFEDNPDFAVVMGRVIRDGACTAGLDWHDALTALWACEEKPPTRPDVLDHVGAYGCNMSLRASLIGDMRFDERLVLYGWQEDIDFTSRLRRSGRVVCVSAIRGVHLGVKAGRVSGKRFGYSQVVNPIYLIRKGSVPASFALPLMVRNLAANVLRSVRPEPYVDRRGRLRGNLLALLHVLVGRIEPEYVLKM